MSTRNSAAVRAAYTTQYYLEDCGGFATYCASMGKQLDARLDCIVRLAHYRAHVSQSSLRVLDLGCGRGELTRYFATQGCRVDAIDYSPDAIQLAESCLADDPASRQRVRFYCGSVTECNWYDDVYDLVLASDVIEHLAPSELAQLYAIVRDHLHDDGIFIIHTFPNLWYYRYGYPLRRHHAAQHGELLPLEPRSAYEQHMHINEQSPRVLRQQLCQVFPHIMLWAGDHQEPAGSLIRPFRKSDWQQAPSLFAIAALQPLNHARVITVLNEPLAQVHTPSELPPRPPVTYQLLHAVRRLPVFSSLVAYLHALLRLPNIHHSFVTQSATDAQRFTQLETELMALRQQLAQLQSQSPAPTLYCNSAESWTDDWYQTFAEQFRGDAVTIRARLAVYLPYIAHSPIHSTTPLLDVGCGRGDWLMLLRDHGYDACGVDANAAAIARARQQGCIVEHSDVFAYLNQCAPQSFGAITALHLIEHLPFSQLLALLNAARRVLVPNGLLIIETPNPENLAVAACHFYIDPTHVRPIVPAVLEFAVVNSGFVTPEVLRLHPDMAAHCVAGNDQLTSQFNAYFHGPRDYAIIARCQS